MKLLVDNFNFRRVIVLVWGFVCAADVAAADSLNPKVDAYLKTYCLGCHSEKSTKSDF